MCAFCLKKKENESYPTLGLGNNTFIILFKLYSQINYFYKTL